MADVRNSRSSWNRWSPDNRNGRMLLVLDIFSGEQGKAAIVIGNPDDANHVAVTSPGMNTNIRNSMSGMVDESRALRQNWAAGPGSRWGS